jgi:hypothetical protein
MPLFLNTLNLGNACWHHFHDLQRMCFTGDHAFCTQVWQKPMLNMQKANIYLKSIGQTTGMYWLGSLIIIELEVQLKVKCET